MIIHGKYLKALALLAPKKEPTRPYLIGVHVEVKGSQAILVATDGAILGALRVTLTEECEAQAFTIPPSLLARITAKDDVTVIYGIDEVGNQKVTLTQGHTSHSGLALGDTYPNYRRVIPENVSGVQDHLIAVRYLETAAKVCSMINGVPMPAVHVHYNGGDACLVDTKNQDFVLVVSPGRWKYNKEYSRPVWLS